MADKLSSPTVDNWANLLWSLNSTDIPATALTTGNLIHLPWLPEARHRALHAYFSGAEVKQRLAGELDGYLLEIDQHKPTGRLGVYFERLWSFAFQHHPDYQLLYQNLPLRSAGRTLGELDFVVHHRPSNRCEHWEIAVKFYLGLPGPFWVGPGVRDRLDIKLKRMAEHQLPLVQRQSVQPLLTALGIRIEQQWALMPGRLFEPLKTLNMDSQPLLHSHWWADLATLRNVLEQESDTPLLRWQQLPKRTWLAPVPPSGSRGIAFESLYKTLEKADVDQPLCFAVQGLDGETSRGFIVPTHWAQRALASLPS
ncbi:DUF1853 family protein [Microbulbifer echini]|uniref:DUF1853 family protein n=1 Tax=Microbulbifer echini TaxID=1529067 RepID=A0ABV4NJZ3_9GAMM